MLFRLSKFFLYASVFSVVIVTTSTLFPFILGKNVWFRSAIDFALVFFLLGILVGEDGMKRYLDRLKQIIKRPLVIAVTAFTLIFLLSSFFAFDSAMAFWSNFERGEGAFQMLHLYAFFLLLLTLFEDRKDWKILFWCVVIVSVLVVLYGVGAGLKYVDAELNVWTDSFSVEHKELTGKGGPLYYTFENFIGPSFASDSFRFQGSFGNPAYVAAYFLFVLVYGLILLLRMKRPVRWGKVITLLASIALFVVFFFFAATRGAFLGLFAGIVAFLFFLGYSHKVWRKRTLLLVAVLILAAVLLVAFRNTPAVESLPFSRLFDISFAERTLQDRLFMWQAAWEGWKERPILGWGPENFIPVFNTHFPVGYFRPAEGFGAWFDRAHNVFVDYLVETGVLGLLGYLSMFVTFYVMMFRAGLKRSIGAGSTLGRVAERGLLFALPLAYLVQGMVLFDVFVIIMNLFIVFAFAIFTFTFDQEYEESEELSTQS